MMVLYTSVLVLATFLVGCSSFSIQYYVDTAISKGADSVVIPPGTYYSFTDATGNIANMNFTNVNNFKMYAYNVTFISTIRARALDILNCSDVAVYGLVIDYNPLTFTQGTIIDINNAYLDLKLHDGYPEASWARVMIVDPKTGLIKDGVGFMWDITANFSQSGVVRVYNTLNQGFYTAKVGDYATLAGGPDGDYACHGIGVSFSSDVSLIDVTIYAAPGFGLADWAGFGGLTLTNFQIVPGPPPAGATQERLQTTSWDGVEHTSMTRGPFVTGLRVERAGDDSWSVVGDVYPISGINAATRELILGGSPPYTLSVGNTLRLRRVDLYPDEYVTVSSIESVPPSPIHAFYCARCAAKARRQSFAASTFTVQVKESIPSNWNVSDQLFSPETTPMGFILQNSYIKSKGRGALIKAPYGIIRNNYFEGGAAGVQVSPEVAGSTGDGADVGYNMYIQGNTIVHNGYHETFNDSTYGAAGAISLFAYIPGPFALRGPDTFINMVIENNTLIDIDGINIAIVASTGVNVLNNIFYNTFPVPYGTIGTAFGFNNGYLVFLSESNNVTLDGNIVHGEGKYKLGNLYVSSSVSNLIGENGGIIQQ